MELQFLKMSSLTSLRKKMNKTLRNIENDLSYEVELRYEKH